MAQNRPPLPAAVGSADDIEQRFYEALQRGDIEALMACWAEDDEVSCVHPGGLRITGYAAVRAAFDAIFASGPIDLHLVSVRRWQSGALAVHAVIERVDVSTDDGPRSAWVAATNVYAATDAGWRLVCHHASPGAPGGMPGMDVPSTGGVLH